MKSHDYDPNWDYLVVELSEIDCLSEREKLEIGQLISRLQKDLAPAMGFETFSVFFTEPGDISDEESVAVYCNGTSSEPVVGLDAYVSKRVCDEIDEPLLRQLEMSIAHELAHAYQDAIGIKHDHNDQDLSAALEDGAETFARHWVDRGSIDLWLINPEEPKPKGSSPGGP